MSTALRDRPTGVDARDGGGPVRHGRHARRAVVRWAWRLFRREWRQQALVLALLIVAVAATTAGTAVATNTLEPSQTTFHLPGSDPQLAADVGAIQKMFGTVEVVKHQSVAVPGSISTVDLRAQDTNGTAGSPTLQLRAGRYPTGGGEVAMTERVAAIFNVRLGDTWHDGGRALQVVGLVENPLNLHDQFALVAPGQADPPDTITVVLNKAPDFEHFPLPSGSPLGIEAVSSDARAAAAAAVLALSTIGLVFVGLVAVAGFTVMAQRRQRAFGMLGAVGGTDRHVRLVMLANGVVVGAVGAVVGTAIGLAGWLMFAPRLETIAGHRIDRFALPWWAIAAAIVLAVVTAVAAAWWPARAASRMPVVTALSGRPPRPQPAHRFATLGGVLLLVGFGCIAVADRENALLIVAGIVGTMSGLLLLAPLAIRGVAIGGRRRPVAVRLALRDLARYQARSGAALGAITLAVGIAATIAVSASAQAAADADRNGVGNLPANELVVYLAPDGSVGAIPNQTPTQVQSLQAVVDDMATAVHTDRVVPLDAAANPNGPDVPGLNGQGGKEAAAMVNVTPIGQGVRIERGTPLYIATPELLAHYGINAGDIDSTADVVSSRTDLKGLSLGYGRDEVQQPKIQTVALPAYSSDPNTLITAHAVRTLGLQALRAAWLIDAPEPLTTTQIDAAQSTAASAGLTVEARSSQQSQSQLGDDATGAGVLVALGVLAMTVGLIRSETANDLRILAATGATSTTRRTLTGATAGALGLLGAVLGTAGAYLALTAWYRSDLSRLLHPPIVDLVVIIVGLPLAATAGGWLLAGREPSGIARRPLE